VGSNKVLFSDRTPIENNLFIFRYLLHVFLFLVLLSPPFSGDFSYKSPKEGKPAIQNQSFHLESSRPL